MQGLALKGALNGIMIWGSRFILGVFNTMIRQDAGGLLRRVQTQNGEGVPVLGFQKEEGGCIPLI